MIPYRVEGCEYLLLTMDDPCFDDLRVGSLLTIDSITYKITHSFHDCCAIEVYYEKS